MSIKPCPLLKREHDYSVLCQCSVHLRGASSSKRGDRRKKYNSALQHSRIFGCFLCTLCYSGCWGASKAQTDKVPALSSHSNVEDKKTLANISFMIWANAKIRTHLRLVSFNFLFSWVWIPFSCLLVHPVILKCPWTVEMKCRDLGSVLFICREYWFVCRCVCFRRKLPWLDSS